MTTADMKARLALMTGESDDEILSVYLKIAGDIVKKQEYPFRDTEYCVVSPQYQSDWLEIAAYLINKRGAEGETAHNENGINRSYESASVPASMLKRIVPYCQPF